MNYYEVYEFNGIGYSKLFDHHNYRVSILNYIEELEIDRISYVEAHVQTDEIFVLLNGGCNIFFAEVEHHCIKSFSMVSLEPQKVYKIPKGIYHTHTLTKDARLLIIEDDDTCEGNSPQILLDHETKVLLKNAHR